jgi:hypothetical protein
MNTKKLFHWLIVSCFLILALGTYAQAPGEWTWMSGESSDDYIGDFGTLGIASSTNKPPGIYEAGEWTDHQGNFWLYGGISSTGWNDNLWKYDVNANVWTWMKGSGPSGNHQPVYSQQGVPSATNSPGVRVTSQTWTDNDGNLWLFGGFGYLDIGLGASYNDLWKYDITTNMWTWMKGDSIPYGSSSYGIKGVEAASNKPPISFETNLTWTDSSNNLWLVDLSGSLWKYKIAENNWIWMNGDTTGIPVLGVKGVPNANNTPGNTTYCFTKWKDSKENFWLLYTSLPNFSVLLKYQQSSNMWTWMWGDTIQANSLPDYNEERCQMDLTMKPYTRVEARTCWTDKCDNLWLMGGSAATSTINGFLNDLIYFDIQQLEWVWAANDTTFNSNSVFGNQGTSNALNKPGARSGAMPFKDLDGNLWFFGGWKGNTNKYLGDLWKYAMDDGCSPCMSIGGNNDLENLGENMVIYPNPFSNEATVEFKLGMENATLLILNSYGQPIKRMENISGDQFTLKRDDLSNGLYIIQVVNKNSTFSAKILITD